MMLEHASVALLRDALAQLDTGFNDLPDFTPAADMEAMGAVLARVAERLQDNFPYPHPFYAGQMLKPPHPVARIAYALAMWINPNNHALDGGRASSAMEKEAVGEIARMFGWEVSLGHLCSGGTMANLEALWVAGRLRPGETVLASEQAHYTHGRISEVLRIPFDAVAVDRMARMDMEALKRRLDRGDVGTVVATAGTTGMGAVDPLPEIQKLQEAYGFRLHVDAAYGGYYTLADNLTDTTRAAFDGMGRADSIVVDPHKHGLQPYGCGCVLFRDPSVGSIYKHDSPYTYFSSDDLHLGEISLECSRPGASAVALWATQKLLPLARGGRFAGDLGKCREAALMLYGWLRDDPRFLTLFPPALDIVVWAPRAATGADISDRSKRHFKAAAAAGLHLALMEVPSALLEAWWPEVSLDGRPVTCLRSCLMKPEHLEWSDRIRDILHRLAEVT